MRRKSEPISEPKPIAGVQKKMRSRLPAWDKLEGKADRILLKESKTRRKHRAALRSIAGIDFQAKPFIREKRDGF